MTKLKQKIKPELKVLTLKHNEPQEKKNRAKSWVHSRDKKSFTENTVQTPHFQLMFKPSQSKLKNGRGDTSSTINIPQLDFTELDHTL